MDKNGVRDHDSIRHIQQNRLHIRHHMYTFIEIKRIVEYLICSYCQFVRPKIVHKHMK